MMERVLSFTKFFVNIIAEERKAVKREFKRHKPTDLTVLE